MSLSHDTGRRGSGGLRPAHPAAGDHAGRTRGHRVSRPSRPGGTALVLVAVTGALVCVAPVGRAADPFAGADPAWNLIHEPAVVEELRLSPTRSREFHGLLDEFDARVFPLRNRPPDEAATAVADTLAAFTKRLESSLSEAQVRRLAEIRTRHQGTAALLRPDLTAAMQYEPRQEDTLRRVIGETQAATRELERRAADGEPRAPLEKRYAELKHDELRHVIGILSPAQKATWQKALGRDFDLTKLGRARFKAPELVDSGAWLNSEPLTLAASAGRVVVLHFYTFGCINCIRNYPTYVDWQERFRDKDVVILGIHTPETNGERDAAAVRAKAHDAGFTFPVLIDDGKANWNAWGNSMWPSVYLIDKRGSLRHYWPGELRWHGATGDVWMRERIEELLAEPATP